MKQTPEPPKSPAERRAAIVAAFCLAKNKRSKKAVAKKAYADLSARFAQSYVKSTISHIRSALRATGADDTLFACESKGGVVPDDLYAELNQQKRAKLWERHNNLRPLDAAEHKRKVMSLLTSDDPHLLALGIMAATGRRMAEVLLTGEFFNPKGASVAFAGQTKTRGATGTRQDAYRIPTLIPGEQAMLLLDKLRAKLAKIQSCAEAHERFAGQLNLKTKRTFGLDWTPKDLRAAYAAICYALKTTKKTSPVAYYSEILGHKLDSKDGAGDLDTPLSYFVFEVVGHWSPDMATYAAAENAETPASKPASGKRVRPPDKNRNQAAKNTKAKPPNNK